MKLIEFLSVGEYHPVFVNPKHVALLEWHAEGQTEIWITGAKTCGVVVGYIADIAARLRMDEE